MLGCWRACGVKDNNNGYLALMPKRETKSTQDDARKEGRKEVSSSNIPHVRLIGLLPAPDVGYFSINLPLNEPDFSVRFRMTPRAPGRAVLPHGLGRSGAIVSTSRVACQGLTACVNIRREGRKGGQTAAGRWGERGRKPRPMIGRVAQRESALTGEDVGWKGKRKKNQRKKERKKCMQLPGTAIWSGHQIG